MEICCSSLTPGKTDEIGIAHKIKSDDAPDKRDARQFDKLMAACSSIFGREERPFAQPVVGSIWDHGRSGRRERGLAEGGSHLAEMAFGHC
jgi:hypothetical protein